MVSLGRSPSVGARSRCSRLASGAQELLQAVELLELSFRGRLGLEKTLAPLLEIKGLGVAEDIDVLGSERVPPDRGMVIVIGRCLGHS